ncbi:MAG TPA: hypothetical protein VM510_15965 [Caulifigura sp.]|jgi:hypothetical protein|nr:hypothetical protein [Caulifigura sp.]
MSTTSNAPPRSCYLFGYNGKQNTGSDARLVCIVEQLRESLGQDLRITVATFDVKSTQDVLKRFSGIRFSKIHPLSALPFFWQLATNDVTVLVEGSTFKQNFSQTLLHVFLMAAWFSKFFRRRALPMQSMLANSQRRTDS